MKKLILLLFLLLPTSLYADDKDDFGTWTILQLNYNRKNLYSSIRGEYRSRDNMQATECWFIQPWVGYKFNLG